MANNKKSASQRVNSVVNVTINGVPMEQFFAEAMAELDNKEINIEKEKIKTNRMKQFNNYASNIIEARKMELTQERIDLDKQKMALYKK